jgi:List-Bact-rpt repeat protein
MNRSSKQFVIAMALAAATFSGAIAGLSRVDQGGMDSPKASTKSGLTIKRGTASGKVAQGNQVSVRADAAPAGTRFACWTGDVAVLADRFSPTTTAMVPFTAATVTATYSSVTTSTSVSENVGGGNVLPPTAKPKGYSLTDIAKATAFFATRGPNDPNGRSKSNEPNVPFQILYDSNINVPHNEFSVRPGTMLYVPIFLVTDSPEITGNFPANVDDPKAVEHYILDQQELGATNLDIEVDGKITSIVGNPRYFVGVTTEPLADGGGTHYITAAVFLTPLTKGTHTVTIRAKFTGAAVGGLFEFEIPYTVIVN